MSLVETTSALTPELLDLMEHEKVIEQGLASFIDVGCALIAIKADRKYRHAGYDTFEDYCRERWNIGSSQRARLMSAASIANDLLESSPIGELPTPTNEAQVRPLAAVPADERAEVWAEAVEAADGGQPTAKQVEQAAGKRRPPKKEHPAPFSDPILTAINAALPTTGAVLDPFAGTGRIHELATDERRTVGVEIEAEWADKHEDTIYGDALEVLGDMADDTYDAISTSPTYGNRMADHHDATDDSERLTYKHTLGRDLTDGNSGAMQWGPAYRAFHENAWDEAVRVLRPGGTFTLNIKNHIRDGVEQRVAEWHISTLMLQHDMEMIALDVIPTRGLMAGANAGTRTGYEFVITFRKGDHD